MKTQIKVFAIIFSVCAVFFSFSAHAGEKVAVLDFKSIMAPPDLGIAVAEILRTELIGVGEYTVIERGMLEEILSEQELQLTGAVDSETAVEIGKLAGADLVVIGSIVKTGSVYTINSRFIEVETGVARVGQNIRGQGEDQISNMVHQLALIIAGKTVTEEMIDFGKTKQPSGESRLLFSFESEIEVAQWKPLAEPPKSMKRSDKHATDGDYSLQVVLPKKKEYPELDTTHSPKDWTPYELLTFDIYYKSEHRDRALPLAIRIDDPDSSSKNQQWYCEGFDLIPGPNTIRIEIGRAADKIDLTQVKRLMLFTEKLDDEAEFYLDNVRFESREQAAQAEQRGDADAFAFSFEDKDEIKQWRPTSDDNRIPLKQSKRHATHGSHSLEAKLPKKSSQNEYPGVYSREFPEDWTPYQYFVADVYWKQEKKSSKKDKTPLFTLRIDDAESDSHETRFNIDEFPLDPGQNEVRIPVEAVGNVLDLTKIQSVHLFLVEPGDKATLYFDNIRLE